MTNSTAINLTAIMCREGIRQITSYTGGFNVVLIGGGDTSGHGATVGEALADARAKMPAQSAAA